MDNINKVFEITKYEDKGSYRAYEVDELYESFLKVYDMYDMDSEDAYEVFDNDILKYFQYTSIHKQFKIEVV